MKKAMVILCVFALLVSVVGAAMAGTADTSKFVLKIKAGDLQGAVMGNYSTTVIGGNTAAGTSAANAWADNKANVATYVGSTYYGKELKLSNASVYTYNLVISMGANFPKTDGVNNQVWITAWAPDSFSNPLPSTGWQLPSSYEVTFSKGSDVLATFTSAQLNRAADPSGTASAAYGFFYTATASGGYSSSTDLLTVTIQPNVPEPSSMLALGSGLMGLVGFAIRRRRA